MRRCIRLVGLAVIVLAATACGQGSAPTTYTGFGSEVGTPTIAADSVLPTPDASGQYSHLTVAHAQQLAPFHVVQPTWVPPYLQAAGIIASVSNITKVQPSTPVASATPLTGPAQVVSMNFMGPWSEPPAVTINELKQGTPLGPPWGPGPGVGPDTTTSTVTIAGHTVTLTGWPIVAIAPPPGPNVAYVWTNQGTTFQLTATQGGEITEQDIERMIASMLQPGQTPQTPRAETPSATPAVPTPDTSGWYEDLTFAQAQQVAPYHLAQPTWVPAYLDAGSISATIRNITEVQPQPPGTEPPVTGPVKVVRLTYFGPPSDYEPWVFIGELKQSTPLGPALEPTPVPSTTTSTTITIAGHPVTRTTWGFVNPPTAPQEGVNAIYVWTDQGTTFQLTAFVDAPLTEQDVEQMIASMLE